MTTEHGSTRFGYALAFLAGAVGGALVAKGAPRVVAKMQEHCQQMMEAGCCAPFDKLNAACCAPSGDEQTHPESQAA